MIFLIVNGAFKKRLRGIQIHLKNVFLTSLYYKGITYTKKKFNVQSSLLSRLTSQEALFLNLREFCKCFISSRWTLNQFCICCIINYYI